MTTVLGSWVSNSNDSEKKIRLRLEYTVLPVAAGQSSAIVTGSVYIDTIDSFADNHNTLSWSGSLLGSGSSSTAIGLFDWSLAVGNGSVEMHNFNTAVTLTGATQLQTVAFSLTGIDYVGASLVASVAATVSIPAKAVYLPEAPTALSFARVSDTRHDGTWSATSTLEAPIDNFEIEKWRLSTNTWVLWTNSLSGLSRSWSDTTTTADDNIRWRIRSSNSEGVSAWAYSNYVWTTPEAATDVTATRLGTDVDLSWTVKARDASSQNVQSRYSTDGGSTWTSWADVPGHTGLSKTTTSRMITGLNTTRLWQFRVATYVTTPTQLISYSSAYATLRFLTPPNAPTLLAPAGAINRELPQILEWQHNPVDTTAQTAAEVRHRPAGGAWTTVSVTTVQQLTVAENTWSSGNVEWQVRTKGQHADFGVWSVTGVFTAGAAPTVVITSPAASAVIDTNKLKITIAYNDPQGAAMMSWRAELLRDGQIIETKTETSSGTSVTFATTLEDLTAYSATFRAIAGTGLASSTAMWSGSTDFIEPSPALLVATWNEPNGTVQLAVENTTVGGAADTASNRIERSDDDGLTWQTIADGLPLNAGMGDDTVPLNDVLLYRNVSVSALGTEAVSVVHSVETSSYRVWLATTGGDTLMLAHDIQVTGSDGHEVVLEDYFGYAKPTAHFGEKEPTTVQVSARVARGYGIEQNRKRFLHKPVFYRDPFGRVFWATLTPGGIQMAQSSTSLGVISFTVEEITND